MMPTSQLFTNIDLTSKLSLSPEKKWKFNLGKTEISYLMIYAFKILAGRTNLWGTTAF